MTDKPREFWIEDDMEQCICPNYCPKHCADSSKVHVIEYKAYLHLKQAADRLAGVLKECQHGECIGGHFVFKCRCAKCQALAEYKEKFGGGDE